MAGIAQLEAPIKDRHAMVQRGFIEIRAARDSEPDTRINLGGLSGRPSSA